jgi:hypothetical protein
VFSLLGIKLQITRQHSTCVCPITDTNLIIINTNKCRQQLSRIQASSLTDEHINQLFWHKLHQGRRKLVEQFLPVLTLQDIQSCNISNFRTLIHTYRTPVMAQNVRALTYGTLIADVFVIMLSDT